MIPYSKLKLILTPDFILITNIKLYRPLYNGIVTGLEYIFDGNFYADKVIERLFKVNKQWGSRDRALVAETIYDMVRHWRLLNELAQTNHIRYSARQVETLIQLYFHFIKNAQVHYQFENKINPADFNERYQLLQNRPEVKNSIPDWMHQLGQSQLKNEWLDELDAMNHPASLVVRVNTLKAKVDDILNSFKEEGHQAIRSSLSPNALIFDDRFAIFKTEAFKNGLIEVQDEGSQVIGDFCGIKPGMRIIDACAGAGGKSLELAALAQNKGKIIAMDVEQWKLDELKKRARRAGAFNIEPRLIEGSKTIKKLENSADVVLLDVPCSGTGVIRRNPDAKWKLQPDFIDKVKNSQQEILQNYSAMTKVGGALVYSTCSLFPSENNEQIKKFLADHSNFELIEERTLTPFKDGTDGFYMAKMRRKS